MSPEMLPPLLNIIQENRNKVARIAVKILQIQYKEVLKPKRNTCKELEPTSGNI